MPNKSARILVTVFAGIAASSLSFTHASDPTVTKIVIRVVAADPTQDPFAAKPKTLYFAGKRYARIEESRPDGAHAIVVDEPNIWLLDLSAQTGAHSVNKGPDFEVHNPILGPDGPEELFDFEYGNEVSFLEGAGAKSAGSREIRGIGCETMRLESQGYALEADVDQTAKAPVELKVTRNGVMLFRIEYLEYHHSLPFDPSLFRPPAEVKISEAN